MLLRTKVFGAILFSSLFFASQLGATEILTTSLSSWEATTTSYSEWNFVFPGGNNSSYNTASGYNLNENSSSYGTTVVTGPDGSGYNLSGNAQYSYNGRTYQALQGASDGTGSMLFTTAAAGLTAFEFQLGESGNTAPITVTLSDGETFTANPGAGGQVWLGLSSGTSITSFTLTTSAGSQVEMTDFLAGVSNQPAATPSSPAAEVTTAIMIGSGLLIFGARRKVFSNRSQPSPKPQAQPAI